MSGPATVKGDDGKDILVGVIMGGVKECGDPSGYTLVTSVYPHLNWIHFKMSES